MDSVIKVSAEAERGQDRMEAAFDEAGIVRIPATTPAFFLMAADDLRVLTSIAALFRCKPRVATARYEDLPEPRESEAPDEDVIALLHHVGYTFNWDEDAQVWCVSGVRDGFVDESPDEPARNERQAAFAALRYLLS